MDHYYNVLGLNATASDTEVKKAYRRLARKYHPDVNPAEDAEERFVEITQAYDYLIEKSHVRPAVFEFEYEEPEVDAEEHRRERARQYARMRYDEFQRTTMAFQESWYYTPVKLIRYLVIYVLYVIAAGLVISPVPCWFITHNVVYTVGYCFLAIVGAQVYALAHALKKGTNAYFGK